MSEIRVLTIRRPWIDLILAGEKKVENRVRNIAGDYRGPIALHASLAWDDAALGDLTVQAALNSIPDYKMAPTPRGHIVGIAYLWAAHHSTQCAHLPAGTCSMWGQPDAVHLGICSAWRLPTPVRWTGRLGMTALPFDVACSVLTQVPTTYTAEIPTGIPDDLLAVDMRRPA